MRTASTWGRAKMLGVVVAVVAASSADVLGEGTASAEGPVAGAQVRATKLSSKARKLTGAEQLKAYTTALKKPPASLGSPTFLDQFHLTPDPSKPTTYALGWNVDVGGGPTELYMDVRPTGSIDVVWVASSAKTYVLDCQVGWPTDGAAYTFALQKLPDASDFNNGVAYTTLSAIRDAATGHVIVATPPVSGAILARMKGAGEWTWGGCELTPVNL